MGWSSVVTTSAELALFCEKVLACGYLFGVDVETTASIALDDAPLRHDWLTVVGIGFGFPDGSKCYFPFSHVEGPRAPEGSYEVVKRVLEDPSATIWAHNSKYEFMALRAFGIEINGTLLCSQIAQFSLGKQLPGAGKLKLKPAARKYLGMPMRDWDEVVPEGTRAHEASSLVVGEYCGDDALAALRLGLLFVPELRQYGAYRAFEEISCEFAKVLAHMREVGIAIDSDRILALDDKFRLEEAKLVREFESLLGVHPNRNRVVSKLLYKDMKLWPILPGLKEGADGEYPVNARVRKLLKGVLSRDSLGFRVLELKDRQSTVSKFLSNYTHSLVSKAKLSFDGRLRCEFNQTIAATGRLASSKPNLQNIPAVGKFGGEIRAAFIAIMGWSMCDADYSQADLRVMAHLSQDKLLMKAYLEDIDVHQQTADFCACDRKKGKIVNLGLIYEMMEQTLAAGLGVSVSEASRLWEAWHSTYPDVQRYQKKMHLFVAEHGYVRTLTGRLRFIPKGYVPIDESTLPAGRTAREERWRIVNDFRASRKYAAAFREASNTPDQGTVADILMIAGRNLYREWKERGVLYDYWTGEGKAKILSFVHDETICEFRDDFAEEGAADVQRHMEAAGKLSVPMKAYPGLGRNWLEAYLDADKNSKAAKVASL